MVFPGFARDHLAAIKSVLHCGGGQILSVRLLPNGFGLGAPVSLARARSPLVNHVSWCCLSICISMRRGAPPLTGGEASAFPWPISPSISIFTGGHAAGFSILSSIQTGAGLNIVLLSLSLSTFLCIREIRYCVTVIDISRTLRLTGSPPRYSVYDTIDNEIGARYHAAVINHLRKALLNCRIPRISHAER